MFTLKPWSEAKPPAILFAEKVNTTKGEVRWSLPVRKGRARRVEACETLPARRTEKQRQAVRLFKLKRRAEGFCRVCCANKPEEEFKSCAGCRAKRNTYMTRITEARVLENICILCGTNESPAGKPCQECRAVATVKGRQRRVELKAAGLCTECTTSPVDGSSPRCTPCREKRKSYKQKVAETRRAQGLCYRCGVNEAPAGTCCADCRAAQCDTRRRNASRSGRRMRSKEDIDAAHVLRLERIAAGYCRNCTLRRPEEGKANCAPCRLRRAARAARRVKARRSGNLCSRCGEAEAPAGKYCDDCRMAGRIKLNARRAERAAAGLCKQCGIRPAPEGQCYCGQCRDARILKDRQRRARQRAAKLVQAN